MKLIIFLLTVLSSTYTIAQTAKSYVLVADTSNSYYELEEKMKVLSKKLNQEVDLKGRIYDEKNNHICLPLDDEDELYAGSYYPRRYSSSTLSIEYINYYDNDKPEKTMALVTMIISEKAKAKTELLKLKEHSKAAFMIEAEIYMGCMH
jgi:hypothetical protein